MTKTMYESERAKYFKVWEHDEYRVWSPGVDAQEKAVEVLGLRTGDSIYDFGCGEGKSVAFFNKIGMQAAGIDFAPNANTSNILNYESALWDMGDLPHVDFGFCCDVMEHLPTAYVLESLREMRRLVDKRVYFRISTKPDTFGPKLIGEPLHLTVQSASWWQSMMETVWPNVRVCGRTDSYATFVVDAQPAS